MQVGLRKSFGVVAACGALAVSPFAGAANANAQSVSAVVWMTDECAAPKPDDGTAQAAGLAGALLGVVLGPLIEAGIKGLGDAIAKAGAQSDIHGYGTLDTHLYTVAVPQDPKKPDQPELRFARRCLVAAFAPKATSAKIEPGAFAARQQAANKTPLDWTGAWDPATTSSLGGALDTNRMSILVASLELSRDGTAFRFVPQYAYLGNAFDKNKERSLTFTVSLMPPGGSADATAVAVRTITFAKVTEARPVATDAARLSATSWMPIPAIPDGVKTRFVAATQRTAEAYSLSYSLGNATLKPEEKTKIEADLKRISGLLAKDETALKQVGPYTVRVDVHQTRPGSPFLVKLGGFLSSNAGKIATPIADGINPDKRAAASEAAAQRVEALRIVAIGEASNWAKAKAASDASAARVAEIKLGAACRQIEAAGFSETACLLTL